MPPLRLRNLATVIAVSLAGCNGTGGEQLPVNVIDLTDGGTQSGCVRASFPAEEPALDEAAPPRFLLTTSAAQNSTSGQAIVSPGDPVEAEITVNASTRQAVVELGDVWTDSPPITSQRFDTLGSETLDVNLLTELQLRPGRFYMRITLCESDCDERQVIYDRGADVNGYYERTVIEDGEVVRVDATCIDFKSNPGLGSRTILIQ